MADEILTDEAITAALANLPGWQREGDELVKSYQFGDFRAAMGFMVRAGFEAEARDHHPAWSNVYNRVDVRLNTHSAGGKITTKDTDLAAAFEAVASG